MTIEKLDIGKTLEKAKCLLKEEKHVSPAMRGIVEVLIFLVAALMKRLGVNSKNSSKPPSQDLNRERKKKKRKENGEENRKPGGQTGHKGKTLEKVENPDVIEKIVIDRRTIPTGPVYHPAGHESRQVVDVKINVHVTEYQAEVLEDDQGNRYVANFPEGVTKAIQYGSGVKADSVYQSMFQLVPLARVEDHFADQIGLPVSKGSIANFNEEANKRLAPFEAWVKEKLLTSELNHADETSVVVDRKKVWIHTLSNDKLTFYHPDKNRGKEAMDRMEVLPKYTGRLCHDHWKAYYQYKNIIHVLCNAHHVRELERAIEQDGQQWAKTMQDFLFDLNKTVIDAGGMLPEEKITEFQNSYRSILKEGKKECPLSPKEPGKTGRQKQSKSRNLLDRLRDFENDTLRFMKEAIVPFTNNQGENDLRMIKVQQKISGCFRSMEGVEIFCRIRGFLSTCRKNGVGATDALRDLFQGKFPEFMG